MIAHHQPAQMPGLVVAHCVAVGETVAPGQTVMVVETMKCEWPVQSHFGGKVGWIAAIGEVVAVGSDLVRIDEREPVRPPAPDDLVDLLCGAVAEPRLAPWTGGAEFRELDLDPVAGPGADRLVEVPRGRSDRDAGIVVGVLSHRIAPHSRPVQRVWLCGDATRALGAVAEPECRRIVAAIDLAEREGLPLEWVTVSSGARISMTSGTENMDWCAVVVRRLVEFTQRGGQVILVVAGINVGAQSYWNAEATMLMHCAGMLVMVEGTAMVLTGHRALGQAGGVTERSDHDLGGTGVMLTNGQAHHRADDLVEAFDLVFLHHSMCATGDGHPPVRAATVDCAHRDVSHDPYDGPDEHGVLTVGEVLHDATNPSRTRPFAIEPVMAAVADRDAPRLRRWDDMSGASGAHVWDTRIDGWAVSMVGIDSRPRLVEGRWEAAGTLYPMGARKVARALTHASGRRPAVVLANLAGFDGSRQSLLDGQLEHGAELARAVVNFRGPLIVVVIGRFHGGAYVVLNQQLNPELRIVALEGTKVSVIGGTAAAEVVLHREVKAQLEQSAAAAAADGGGVGGGGGTAAAPGTGDTGPHHRRLAVREVADRFDEVHDVQRARRVGSVEQVIEPGELRSTVAAMLAESLEGAVGGDDPGHGPESFDLRSPASLLAGTGARPA